MPPNTATFGTICPQFLLFPWLSNHLPAPPHTPVVVPVASGPLPCLPYSLLKGVIRPLILSHRASIHHPLSIVGHPTPTHSVYKYPYHSQPALEALGSNRGFVGPAFVPTRGGVRSIWYPCACPKVSSCRGFVGLFSSTRCRDVFLNRSKSRRISLTGKPQYRVKVDICHKGSRYTVSV